MHVLNTSKKLRKKEEKKERQKIEKKSNWDCGKNMNI